METRERLKQQGWIESADGSLSHPSRSAVGGVPPAESKQNSGSAAGVEVRRKEKGAKRVANRRVLQRCGFGQVFTVALVAHVAHRLDDDNLIGGLKWLRDEIAATLGVDDGSDRVLWEYGQIETHGRTGVSVSITLAG
jgi:hypothetical protein